MERKGLVTVLKSILSLYQGMLLEGKKKKES
jgi:hypothetical protein